MAGRLARRQELIPVALLTVAGAALRFSTLGARGFWSDESFTVLSLRPDFGTMLSRLPHGETNPPLYFVLAWPWSRLFGSGEVGVRSLSALIGAATIPVVYAAARRLGSRRAATMAALLAAVSPMLVWQAQDARPYALTVLLAAVSFLCFVSALQRPSPRALTAWAVSSALALATHYFTGFPIAIEAVWLLAALPQQRRSAGAAVGAVGLAVLALLPLALAQGGRHAASFLDSTSLLSRAAQIGPQFAVGFQPPLQLASAAAASALVAVAFVLLATRGEPRERAAARLPLVVGAGGIALSLAAVVAGFDFVYTRYVSAAWAPLCIAVAIGFGARRAGRWGPVALAALCALSLAIDAATAGESKFGHEDWRAAAAAAGPARVARAVVVSPRLGRLPLAIYGGARDMPRSGARVEEVVLVGLPPSYRQLGETPHPPRPASPPAPPGFVLAGRENARTYTLVRYRASRARRLGTAVLRPMALTPGRLALLLERP